jgi:hypothetical protein
MVLQELRVIGERRIFAKLFGRLAVSVKKLIEPSAVLSAGIAGAIIIAKMTRIAIAIRNTTTWLAVTAP